MRIATNVNALNSWRNLSITNNSLSKTLEKLSSGYRINRAADDAAGLAISEKMRGQIAGINMAVKNAQDGISLIQTAEGALNEAHAMLKRMEELAVQAANDTNTADDRAKLQSEMDQLAQEIARIGSTTEFNTLRLLDGSFDKSANNDIVFHIGANENQNLRINIGDMRSKALGLAADTVVRQVSVTGTIDTDPDGGSDAGPTPADGTYTVSYDGTNWSFTDGTNTFTSADGTTFTTGGGTTTTEIAFSQALPTTDLGQVTIGGTGTTAAYNGLGEIGTNDGLEAGVYTAKAGELLDQNGKQVAVWDTDHYEDLDGNTVFSPTGGTELAADSELVIGGIDISSSQAAANSAFSTIRGALELVSSQRSLFGATQNRLEHTINNLQVAAENLSAAESRIRDVDMAAEMANFTRNQILLQAGTAMLAQANAAPQSVLQLLG